MVGKFDMIKDIDNRKKL